MQFYKEKIIKALVDLVLFSMKISFLLFRFFIFITFKAVMIPFFIAKPFRLVWVFFRNLIIKLIFPFLRSYRDGVSCRNRYIIRFYLFQFFEFINPFVDRILIPRVLRGKHIFKYFVPDEHFENPDFELKRYRIFTRNHIFGWFNLITYGEPHKDKRHGNHNTIFLRKIWIYTIPATIFIVFFYDFDWWTYYWGAWCWICFFSFYFFDMPEAKLVGKYRDCQLEYCSFWSNVYVFFFCYIYVIWSGWFIDGQFYNEEYVFFLEVLQDNIDEIFEIEREC